MRKSIVAALVGIAYAVIYGLWTMSITGGGHGNFVWFLLFLFVELSGLYFPLMAVLAVNLHTRISRIIFGSLIIFNLIASSILLFGWATEIDVNGQSDFWKIVQISGFGFILLCLAAHFLPTFLFIALFFRTVAASALVEDNDEPLRLKLI